MLIGQALRRFTSQTAFAIFTWLVVWGIIAICASYGPVGQAVALGIIAINLITRALSVIRILIEEQSRQDWRDRLTNRKFEELFWEKLRDVEGASFYLDIADIKKAAAETSSNDFIDKTRRHVVGGILHFVAILLADVIYYGSAFWVGSAMTRPF
jgi:hypothetical protein